MTEASEHEEVGRLKAQLGAIELHADAERSFIAAYGLDALALEAVYDYMGPHPANLPNVRLSQLLTPRDVWKQSEEQLTSLLVRVYGGKRRFSKQTWIGGRSFELWAYVTNLAPTKLVSELQSDSEYLRRNSIEFASRVGSFSCGVAFGRWDVRYATGERPAPELPDPFAPLPVCPPGQLQNTQGLPARPEDVPATYPIRIPWDGILVDDPNQPLDIERRVREVIEIIWKDRAEAIEHEACEILGVKSLRDYFQKPTAFFSDHLKRYSKSRRQAPIYWPLSTTSGAYTIWLYYHRLNDQTLYTAVNNFVEPKLEQVYRELAEAERILKSAGGGEATRLRDRLDDLRTLRAELADFKTEVLRIAALPYKPNLNDGVIINAAPFHKLFRHRPWAKSCKECWDNLEAGEYDWAHLALNLWPDRVKEACKTDKSIAIAHNLEHLYVEPPATKKPRKRKAKQEAEIEEV